MSMKMILEGFGWSWITNPNSDFKKRSCKQQKLNRLLGIAIELCHLSINLEKKIRIIPVQDCIQDRILSSRLIVQNILRIRTCSKIL